MSNRQYTQEELQHFVEAEHILRTQGLIVDDKDGKDLVNHNAERIAAYFDLNPQTSINVQTVLKACEDMHDQMRWKPEEQIAFQNIYATLNPQEKQAFNSWVRPQRLINNDRNNAAILVYLKQNQRYEVNHRTLLQASVDRIATQLEWQPTPKTVDPRRHTDDGTGFLRDEKNPRYRNNRINHAFKERQQEAPTQATPPDAWRQLADTLLRHGTHSQQAAFRQIYETGISAGKSWRTIYVEMEQLRKSSERVTARF
jgi:hypothetical protein